MLLWGSKTNVTVLVIVWYCLMTPYAASDTYESYNRKPDASAICTRFLPKLSIKRVVGHGSVKDRIWQTIICAHSFITIMFSRSEVNKRCTICSYILSLSHNVAQLKWSENVCMTHEQMIDYVRP